MRDLSSNPSGSAYTCHNFQRTPLEVAEEFDSLVIKTISLFQELRLAVCISDGSINLIDGNPNARGIPPVIYEAVRAIRTEKPKKLMLGFDCLSRPDQGLEFESFIAVIEYADRKFRTGVINYQPATDDAPAIIRPIDWDNQRVTEDLRSLVSLIESASQDPSEVLAPEERATEEVRSRLVREVLKDQPKLRADIESAEPKRVELAQYTVDILAANRWLAEIVERWGGFSNELIRDASLELVNACHGSRADPWPLVERVLAQVKGRQDECAFAGIDWVVLQEKLPL
ncbi:MAG: hypothetical protein K1X83_12880 [Oligoflexia bacterium]|nr:hypothetical protein [Oligoflexia bacterium]